MPIDETPPFVAQPNTNQSWEDFASVLQSAEHARLAGDVERARVFFERLIELDSNDLRGWIGLAETTPDLDEKIVRWGYVSALKPENAQASIQLSACLDEKIARADEADHAALASLAHRLADLGLRAAAYRLFTRATELDPSNVASWLGRASAASQTRQVIYCLQQALAIDPDNAQAKADLGAALQKQKSPRAPSQPASGDNRLAFEQGQAAFQAGELEQAHAHFKAATEIDPNDALAWFWRGGTSATIAEALTCIERVLEIDPANQSAKEALWWLRIKKYCADLTATHPALFAPVNEPPIQSSASAEPRRMNWIALASIVLIVLLIILATQILFRP